MRAGYFSPHAVRFYVFARVCAVVVVPSLVLLSCLRAVTRSLGAARLRSPAAVAVGVGVLGPDAYLVSSPVLANCRVSPEFSGSPGSVDCLRHRGSHRGGVIREDTGPAQQAKPSAWPQHCVDGGRDARGEKLCRRLGRVRGPAGIGRSGILRRCVAAFCGARRRRRHDAAGIQ